MPRIENIKEKKFVKKSYRPWTFLEEELLADNPIKNVLQGKAFEKNESGFNQQKLVEISEVTPLLHKNTDVGKRKYISPPRSTVDNLINKEASISFAILIELQVTDCMLPVTCNQYPAS